MESRESSCKNHMITNAFGPVHWSRDFNNQTTQAPAAVQLAIPDRRHYDLYTSPVRLHTEPGAVIPSTADNVGLRQMFVDRPSQVSCSVSRSSVDSSSTASKSDATVAHRGPSFRDVESTTPQDTASRQPLRPCSGTVPRQTLRQIVPTCSNLADTARSIRSNRWCQDDVASVTESRQDDVINRRFGPVFDDRSFRSSSWGDKVLTLSGLDEVASPDNNVVGGFSRQSDNLHTLQVKTVDSGTAVRQLADLKRRLAERDMELRTLRMTMERNETAMLKVTDDRRNAWQLELTKRQVEWKRLIQDRRDRCERTEHLLKADISRLERENASLRAGERRELKRELELKTARARINRLNAELELKHAEIHKLHTMVDKRQTATTHCACSVDTGSHQHVMTSSDDGATPTTVAQPPGDTRCNEAIPSYDYRGNQVPASGDVTSADEVARLQEEVAFILNQLDSTRRQFDEERRRWTMEKERVITYQKHLQLKYVQMAHRSVTLEMERHQLISQLATTVGGPGEMTTVLNAYHDESHC